MTAPAYVVDRVAIRRLLPHRGQMCLLDGVSSWDQHGLSARANSHRAADHPLRSSHGLAGLHLIEYGAQAMAVHGGLLAQAEHQTALPGMLVSVRNIKLEVTRIDDIEDDLDIVVQKLLTDTGAWLYRFAITAGARALAQGRLAVMTRAAA